MYRGATPSIRASGSMRTGCIIQPRRAVLLPSRLAHIASPPRIRRNSARSTTIARLWLHATSFPPSPPDGLVRDGRGSGQGAPPPCRPARSSSWLPPFAREIFV